MESMKKIISIFSVILIAVFFTFTVFKITKADESIDYTPVFGGAQIRTTYSGKKQGFKFTATVGDNVDFTDPNVLEHGFFMAKATCDYDTFISKIIAGETTIETETSKSKILNVKVNGTNKQFSVTLVGLENEIAATQEKNFLTDVTVVSYVKVAASNEAGYEYIFNNNENKGTRNIAQIALNTLQSHDANGNPVYYDEANFAHVIAKTMSGYFVRAHVSDDKTSIEVSSEIFINPNAATDAEKQFIQVYQTGYEFVMGDTVEVALPDITSKYYNTLTYNDKATSSPAGTTITLTKGDKLELALSDWSGAAFVDSNLTIGDEVILQDADGDYLTGSIVFDTINNALAAEGVNTIKVSAGTYDENITIGSSDITLLGDNANISATGERIEETILTGTITLNQFVNNTTIQGFKFTGTSMVQVDKTLEQPASGQFINNDGINFINNYVDVTSNSGKGFLDLEDTERYQSKDVVITGNYFTGSVTSSMIYFNSNINLTITDNTFANVTGHCLYVYETATGRGLSGNVNVSNNVFNTISTAALSIDILKGRIDYAEILDSTEFTYQFNNNKFSHLTGTAIYFKNSGNTQDQIYTVDLLGDTNIFEINGNTFNDVRGKGVFFETSLVSSGNSVDFSISDNTFTDVTAGGIVIAPENVEKNTGEFIYFNSTNSEIKMNGNIFTTIGDKAIQLTPQGSNFILGGETAAFQINNNNITGATGTGIWASSIECLTTTTANITINTNTVTDSKHDGICINNILNNETVNLTVNVNQNILQTLRDTSYNGDGIYMDVVSATTLNINNNNISDSGNGIYLKTMTIKNDINLVDNVIDQTGYGLYVYATYMNSDATTNFKIFSNEISNTSSAAIYVPEVYTNALNSNVDFNENIINTSQSDAICIDVIEGTSENAIVNVNKNSAQNLTVTAEYGDGIYFQRVNVKELNINNNTLDTGRYGIIIDYVESADSSISATSNITGTFSVNGNTISNITVTDTKGEAIILKNIVAGALNVNNNKIDTAKTGITSTLISTNNLVVEGNEITAVTNTGILLTEVALSGNTDAMMKINGNSITKSVGSGINIGKLNVSNATTATLQFNTNTIDETSGAHALRIGTTDSDTFYIASTVTNVSLDVCGNTITNVTGTEGIGTAIWWNHFESLATSDTTTNINDNTIDTVNYDGIVVNTITSTSTTSLLNINDNKISNAGDAIFFSGSHPCTYKTVNIKNNTIVSCSGGISANVSSSSTLTKEGNTRDGAAI